MTKSRVFCIRDWKIENIFIVVFCVIGILYMIALPPFRMTDEYRHFIRAYEVAQGNIISEQMSPEEIAVEMAGETTWKMWIEKHSLALGDNWVYDSSIPSSYSPFTYFTATIVLFFTKFFTDNLLVLVYAARLGQFIAVALLLYPAIKYAPSGKNLFVFFSLLPMCMQEFTALSGDALVIVLTIDVVVFVLYQRNRMNGKLSAREIVAMFLMVFFLGQCKCIYVFVCLLYFFIPKERFGGVYKKAIYAVLVGAITSATILAWYTRTGSINVTKTVANNVVPFSFPEILARTFAKHYKLYIASAMADSFGDLDIHPNMIWTYLLLLILLYVGLLEDKKELNLNYRIRITMIISAVSSVLALFWVFSSWTSPETGITNGLQGRYFIPIYLVGILGVSFSFHKIRFPKISHKLFLLGMMIINLGVVSSIFSCCVG